MDNSLPIISLLLYEKFEQLSIVFREKNSANNIISVTFSYVDVRLINNERVILGGILNVKNNHKCIMVQLNIIS